MKTKTTKVVILASALMGKIASFIGYFIGGIGLIAFIALLADNKLETDDVLLLLFFFAPISAFGIYKGIQIKSRIKRFRRYVSLISENIVSIENLAASTAKPVDFVKKDLQKMINRLFFSNAVINDATNEIIIGGMKAANQNITQATDSVENEIFTCDGCGARIVKAKGIIVNCEYCGSPLK